MTKKQIKTASQGMLLSTAILKMKNEMQRRDLSDRYLRETGGAIDTDTRRAVFAGEWSYGITMVPCSFAIQLAEKVLAAEGDQFIPFEAFNHERNRE